jgi:radical SAM-linked protein
MKPRPPAPVDSDKTTIKQKASVLFAKTGPAIYHSHHDMIRFWERAVKRANLPIRLTQGFNPRPRLVFPHALGLGVETRHEELELEFYEEVELDELVGRLSAACEGVLDILSATSLPPVKKGRIIKESSYRLSGWPVDAADAIAAKIAELLAAASIVKQRGAPGSERQVDIRPFIKSLSLERNSMTVFAVFSHDNTGSARLDEIASLLGDQIGYDWRMVKLEKTGMIVE